MLSHIIVYLADTIVGGGFLSKYAKLTDEQMQSLKSLEDNLNQDHSDANKRVYLMAFEEWHE